MTIQNVVALHSAIEAACPIVGVSGEVMAWFHPSATVAEQAAAKAALAAFVDSPSPPQSISRRQFFQQLAMALPWAQNGTPTITQAAALAAVQVGTIPAQLQGLVSGLPATEQFGATMMIAGNSTFERHHPLVILLGAAFGWTSAQIDQFWTTAAVLRLSAACLEISALRTPATHRATHAPNSRKLRCVRAPICRRVT